MEIREAIEGMKQAIEGTKQNLVCDENFFVCDEDFIPVFETALTALEEQERNRWIPVSDRLPDVKINPMTNDYVKYDVTFKSYGNYNEEIYDVRQYGYGEASGGKHWLHGGSIMDKYVIAWRPLPDPFKGGES